MSGQQHATIVYNRVHSRRFTVCELFYSEVVACVLNGRGKRDFVTRRHTAWPTGIRSTSPSHGWRRNTVEAERRAAVLPETFPLASSWTRQMRTDGPVMPDSGLTEVRVRNWRRSGERRSGPAADEWFRERVERRTCPSVISGAGGRSFGKRGWVRAAGEE